jgi:hypothetical protein
MREWWFIPLRVLNLWGYQDTDMSGDFLNSFFEATYEVRSSEWERSTISRCCPYALHVKESYESMKLLHTVLNNVTVFVGIWRWQFFSSTRSLFMWNISAVRVHWRQSGVLWRNGLIINPIHGLKNITGHPLADKREVALPPLPNTLGYKLDSRRLSVFIYLCYFSYSHEIHERFNKPIGYRISQYDKWNYI